jgi:hypothetical protein
MTDIIDRLKAAENERQRALVARQRATHALARLIVEARGEGMNMTEISRATEITRPNLYQLAALVEEEE